MLEWALRLAAGLWGMEAEIHALSPGDSVQLPDILTHIFGAAKFRLKISVTREA